MRFIRESIKGSVAIVVALTLVIPTVSLAQQETSTPEPGGGLDEFVKVQSACDFYKYDSVAISTGDISHVGAVAAGEAVTIPGTVKNKNTYALPSGRLWARVLRHDDVMGPDNWYPYVGETNVAGDWSLAPRETKDFVFKWTVPTRASAGIYQVDFFYLAAGRFVMAGTPYVTNVPGASALFNVEDNGMPAEVTFDRNSVTLAGESLALRSVPPTLPVDEPVTIRANLSATEDSPAIVTKALYGWSDMDGNAPIKVEEDTVRLSAGKEQHVSFTWDNPEAGVYELVLTTTPFDASIAPSILKVRFPIEGNTPRIIFSGVTDRTTDGVVVSSCAVNGTFSSGGIGGSLDTSVKVAGQTVGSATQETSNTDLMFGVQTQIPLDKWQNGDASVTTIAKDDKGMVTDQTSVAYQLGDAKVSDGDPMAEHASASNEQSWERYVFGTMALVLIVLLVGVGVWSRRKKPESLV